MKLSKNAQRVRQEVMMNSHMYHYAMACAHECSTPKFAARKFMRRYGYCRFNDGTVMTSLAVYRTMVEIWQVIKPELV